MSLPRTNHDLSNMNAAHPDRREQLKKRNPINWHLKTPTQGPATLAIKNHFIAMVGEYVGTVLFMIFALGGTNVANIPTTSVTGATTAGQDGTAASTANTSNLLYIALSFGFSLAVNAWIFFRVSGGLFNPAVSLGMVLVGALTPLRGALLTFSQILGGITGAAIIQAITPGTLNVRTTLGGGTSIVQGLFIEMFLTSLLMLAILLLAAEKHKATFIAPIGIGLALFVAELLGVYYTGGSLNPARSFGPAVVLRTFSGYHWIYWVGPALGATIAAGFYKMLKWLQYETVLGPESDGDEPTRPAPSSGTANTNTNTNTGGYVPPHDVEKGGRTLAVSGPGLGDLLTEGPNEAVFDLERHPGPMEARLDKIETMLSQLLEARPRPSASTYVEHPSPPHQSINGGYAKQNVEYAVPHTRDVGLDNHNHNHVEGQECEHCLGPDGIRGHHTPFSHGAAGAGPRDHVDYIPANKY
ncbi:hypothetical protein CI109_102297 [Kwoniella shandongensis]|uniref:Uncharacterized protein n=1 Tax=Kwoniella shandongensis TaxID=1734106 RepID=A0A5M6BP73_9TREE|nr:uncharacterized protein CI109_007127 [Kwoniella shandongensis]KAA5524527.1 hypothetical protein CI109_007127 [Kwoniella shandongensis]